MDKKRKLDTNKTLKEIAEEGWTVNELFAAFGLQLDDQQEVAEEETNAEEELVNKITEILLEIGMPANLLGYRYSRMAIKMATMDVCVLDYITKGLYYTVAKEFGTAPSRVERAIRIAVENAWNRGDCKTLAKYFENSISEAKGKPTNKEFIAQIADHLRLQGYGVSK